MLIPRCPQVHAEHSGGGGAPSASSSVSAPSPSAFTPHLTIRPPLVGAFPLQPLLVFVPPLLPLHIIREGETSQITTFLIVIVADTNVVPRRHIDRRYCQQLLRVTAHRSWIQFISLRRRIFFTFRSLYSHMQTGRSSSYFHILQPSRPIR